MVHKKGEEYWICADSLHCVSDLPVVVILEGIQTIHHVQGAKGTLGRQENGVSKTWTMEENGAKANKRFTSTRGLIPPDGYVLKPTLFEWAVLLTNSFNSPLNGTVSFSPGMPRESPLTEFFISNQNLKTKARI